MRPRSSTKMARNFVVTSATVANATMVTSATILTRPDLRLVIPNPVVRVDEQLVRPKHPGFASTSVTTRSVNTEMNVDSNTARMTSENVCKPAHPVKLLGNAINSAMKATASSEIDAVSLTRRLMPLMVMLSPTLRRMLRNNKF